MNERSIRALIRAELDALEQRVAGLVSRVVVTRLTATTATQEAQVTALEGETVATEHVQSYGLTASPPEGAQGVALSVGGQREQMVTVAIDDRRSRPRDLARGEVALYDHNGQRIHLRDTDIVVVIRAGGAIRLGRADLTAANGAVHGQAIDPLTGLTYAALGSASPRVLVEPS